MNKPGRPTKPAAERAVTVPVRLYRADRALAEHNALKAGFVTPGGKPNLSKYLRHLINAD